MILLAWISPAAVAQRNLVVFDSPPGDYIGAGQTYVTTDTSQFNITGTPEAFTVTAFGYWFAFDGPGESALGVGRHPNALRTPFNGGQPGISISGNGRGCNTVSGSFEILEMEVTDGTITRLWLKYRHSCEGFMPAGTGEIRINSATAPEFPEPRTLHVPGEYPTFAAAIDAAALTGDTILVAPGIYQEALNFRGKRLRVLASQGPALTEIVGSPAAPILTVTGGQGPETRLEGFTLRDGSGGGVNLSGSSPTLAGNIISNCSYGVMVSGASPVIVSNRIIGSYGSPVFGLGNGSGVHLQGSGSAQILENEILENMAGITCWAAGTPRIQGNWIQDNLGDGISHVNSSDSDIFQNIISGNKGHGIVWLVPFGNRGPRVVFNTIADNGGNGIFADGYDGASEIIDNIIVGPVALYCGNFNDINSPSIRFNHVFSPLGTPYGGTCPDMTGKDGNVGGAPRFLSTGDYHLQADSPGIDRGTRYEGFETDLEGNLRGIDANTSQAGSPDPGALEYVPQPPRPPDPVMASSLADGALLAWNAFDAAKGYVVTRSTQPSGPFLVIGSVDGTRYEDRSVTVGTVYWYSVAGTNRWGIGSGTSPVAMRAANRAPVAGPDAVETDEDTPVRTDLLANDRDPEADEFTWTLLDSPPDIEVGLESSGILHLSPHPNWYGTNTIRYRLEDVFHGVSTGLVTVVVKPVNDAPVAYPRQFSITPDGSEAVLALQAVDLEGDPLTAEVVAQGAYGRARVLDGALALGYRPAHGFSGRDVVAVRVSDGRSYSEPVSLVVDVRKPIDRDTDGMADAWEELWDLNNPLADPDGDGVSNRDEYVSLTSPRDPTSYLHIDRVEATAEGYLRFEWPTVGGVRYRIQVSESGGNFADLLRPMDQELDSGAYGEPSRQVYLDLRPLSSGVARFYRIRVVGF
ncbi:MAG: Ig-like domain-containing protein [Verrucomicrobiota bacterium]